MCEPFYPLDGELYDECDVCGDTAVLRIHPGSGEHLCAPCFKDEDIFQADEQRRTDAFMDQLEVF